MLPGDGDVSCDDSRTIVDALLIAQYTVGTRTASECPLTDAATQLDPIAGDLNEDGRTDIVDALLIARCDAGLPADWC